MTNFRRCLRAFLTALAFGLFAASILGRLTGWFDDIPVNLPATQSETPIIVQPESERFPLRGGGGGGGSAG